MVAQRLLSNRKVVVFFLFFTIATHSHAQNTLFNNTLGFFDPKFIQSYLGRINQTDLIHVAASIPGGFSNELSSFSIPAGGSLYYVSEEMTPLLLENLGSFYLEPPWTLKKGSYAFGASYSRINFNELDGEDLNDVYTDVFESMAFSVKKFDLSADIVNVVGKYGVLDNFELGLILPFISLHGESNICNDTLGLSVFSWDRRDTGIGDMMLRTKYEIFKKEGIDEIAVWSVGLDLKLPSGDEDRLLGSGSVGVQIRTLAGMKVWRMFPSLSLAYLWSNVDALETYEDNQGNRFPTGVDSDDYDTLSFRAALPLSVIDYRWTISPEFLFRYNSFATQCDFALAARVRPMSKALIQGGVRIPLDNNGLRTEIIPTVSVEIRF